MSGKLESAILFSRGTDEGARVPAFISYSSQEREFADTFAVQLVRRKVHVWFDKWELRADDCLITKIH